MQLLIKIVFFLCLFPSDALCIIARDALWGK